MKKEPVSLGVNCFEYVEFGLRIRILDLICEKSNEILP
jgi:hypothetical protein